MLKLYDLKKRFKENIRLHHEDLDHLVESSQYILGPSVANFEEKIASFTQHKHSVAVGNGTDALILSLKSLSYHKKWQPESEIITSPLSYLATTSSILLSGLTPVFADIDSSLNIDPSDVVKLITSKTVALQIVHYSGLPANMSSLYKIAEDYSLSIIEDCAQAFGAVYKKNHVGYGADYSTLSFHPLKLLPVMGDGGMILSNHTGHVDWLLSARNHGHIGREDSLFASINSRLDSLQAEIGLNMFDSSLAEIQIRRQQVNFIKSNLDNHLIDFPCCHPDAIPSYNWLVLLVRERSKFQEYMNQCGIETKIHYKKLITDMKFTNHLPKYHTPKATMYARQIVSVPIGSHLSSSDIQLLVSSLNKFNP